MAAEKRLLAASVRGDQVCTIVLVGDDLEHWDANREANKDVEAAVTYVYDQVRTHKADMIVVEHPDTAAGKCRRNREIIAELADAAPRMCGDSAVIGRRFEENRYVRAAALAERYPQLLDWLRSEPPIWKTEPRQLIYFEALDLALGALGRNSPCRQNDRLL